MCLAEILAVLVRFNSTDRLNSESNYLDVSFAERLLKRKLVSKSNVTYLDTRFRIPTYNICERLFSKAGHALSIRRKKNFTSQVRATFFCIQTNDSWNR